MPCRADRYRPLYNVFLRTRECIPDRGTEKGHCDWGQAHSQPVSHLYAGRPCHRCANDIVRYVITLGEGHVLCRRLQLPSRVAARHHPHVALQYMHA